MRKFFALLKLSVKSMLLTASIKGRGKRKRAATGIGAMALIGGLGLYLSGIYSSLLMDALAPAHMEALVFTLMGIAALLGGLMFTMFAVKGVVFGGRDNDLLLSMPVPTATLAASRMAAIYVENLVFAFFVLLPAGVACAVLTQQGAGRDPLFWVRLLLCALLLPLLDTALSVPFGALLAFGSSKVSKGNVLGQNLVMALILVLAFWFSFHLNEALGDLAANAAGIKSSLSWAAPLVWMGDGIMGNWAALLAFAVSCVLPFAAVAFGLGKVYRKAVTAFQSHWVASDYKLSAQGASGPVKALLKKEVKRFFGTPMYFWNTGLGLLLLLAMAAAALLNNHQIRELIGQLGEMVPISLLLALVVILFLGMCPISAPSFSLEGRCFWIVRTAPVEEKTLIWVKTGFHLLLTAPCGIAAAVCLTVALALPLWQGTVALLAVLLFAFGHACFSTLMGLVFPKMDAVNETVVVKQSIAVLLSIGESWAVLGVAVVLYWLGSQVSAALALLLPLALLVLLAALCAALLVRNGPRLVRAL